MPTKFVVLWLRTIFIDEAGSALERIATSDTKIEADHFPTLEDAWRRYNELCAKDENQQVMILVPLKDFNRSLK